MVGKEANASHCEPSGLDPTGDPLRQCGTHVRIVP